MSRLAKLFELDRKGVNVPRGVTIAAVLFVPLVATSALGHEEYWLSVTFGALFVASSDPGGDFSSRASRMAEVGLIGALLTALGFGIGGERYGFAVLAIFVVTLLSGLAVKFGLRRFGVGVLLNGWFLIALFLPSIYQLDRLTTNAWAQTLAWIIGAALWIGVSCVIWLARGQRSEPAPVPEIPGSTSPVNLTRPIILFALIRAVTLSITVAFAFGSGWEYAYWMPIATLVAMKPSLDQTTFVAEQRLAGATLGAAIAAVFLVAVDNKHALEVAIVVFVTLAATIRGVNYAIYCTAIAAAVLIAIDLPHPSNFGDEGRRVLFTFIGVGVGVVVMFLASLLQKRQAKTAQ